MLSINEKYFTMNGEPFFLNSAEMHYFRIKKELWPEHLQKIKDAGCNAVSSYIPWDWHETEEGKFDTTGKSLPERDVEGWFSLCQQYGLYNIVKPGPYILAEYAGAGIPEWFMKKYGKACEVKNSAGNTGQDGIVSFTHPTFLKAVKKWYANILGVIQPRQIQKGGNIILMQVCNEVGVFTWLSRSADNSPHCIQQYHNFLQKKYSDIKAINKLYGKNYENFSDIVPLPDTQREYQNKTEMAMDQDWHAFWRSYYADYIELLINEMDLHGIELQLYHNLPGWIYGSGYEFPVNITMYTEFKRFYPRLILGVDHIPENVSYRNLHDDLIINEIVLAQQGRKGPIFGAEFQAGSREYCSVTFPGELDLFYKASLANGLVGWNYYMFSSGKNPSRKGHFGPSFYWFTPLNEKAEKGSLYPVVQKMGEYLATFGKNMVKAKRKSEIAVIFYEPYYGTELAKDFPRGSDVRVNPVVIRKDAYFNGLLKVLQILNVDFDIVDVQSSSGAELKAYRQVWAFTCDIMDGESQSKLLQYTQEGGSLIIYPTLPRFDLHLQKCEVLREAMGIKSEEIVVMQAPKVDVLDAVDLSVSKDVIAYTLDGKFEKAAQTVNGHTCGFIKQIGKGKAMTLGFYMGYGIEEHKKAYWRIIETMGVQKKQSDAKNGRLVVKERFDGASAFLFIGNYYNEAEADTVLYTHPETGENLTIPLDKTKMLVNPVSGVVSPIHYPLAYGLHLLHTTSDIRSIAVKGNVLELTLSGMATDVGEIAFSGSKASEITSVSVDGTVSHLNKLDKYSFVRYPHNGGIQMVTIELK